MDDLLSRFAFMLDEAAARSPVINLRPCQSIDDVLVRLEKEAKSGSSSWEPQDHQIEAVRRFSKTGRLETLREARLVAFGLAVRAFSDGRCIIEDRDLFEMTLLGEAGINRWRGNPGQFRKCYQGLIRSYFDYDGEGRAIPEIGRRNWRQLRDYLNANTGKIRGIRFNPDWVDCALANTGLFTASPCGAYGEDLLNGKYERVREVQELLGISDSSWFTRELILSQVEQATRLNDLGFHATISDLLKLFGHNEVLRDRALQMILNRYVRMTQKPQHQELRDYAVAAWGNPWLPSNKDRWGGVDEAAHQMVSEWLSREYIELFFTKLAQDGLSDTRRVQFWSKYVPVIDRIHFALGARAQDPNERDFIELREKLKGLIVDLHDNNINNNAFIMTMGDLVAVEFSGTSNAFYGYDRKNLPFDLTRTVYTPVNAHNSLKRKPAALYMTHQDRANGLERWEQRFEKELASQFGIAPANGRNRKADPAPQWNDDLARPASTVNTAHAPIISPVRGNPATAAPQAASAQPAVSPRNQSFSMDTLMAFARKWGYGVQNLTHKGGALWVLAPYDIDHARAALSGWGFTYKAGRGWWKKI
jgi:hypothetical protein